MDGDSRKWCPLSVVGKLFLPASARRGLTKSFNLSGRPASFLAICCPARGDTYVSAGPPRHLSARSAAFLLSQAPWLAPPIRPGRPPRRPTDPFRSVMMSPSIQSSNASARKRSTRPPRFIWPEGWMTCRSPRFTRPPSLPPCRTAASVFFPEQKTSQRVGPQQQQQPACNCIATGASRLKRRGYSQQYSPFRYQFIPIFPSSHRPEGCPPAHLQTHQYW
ncbi:hypothetical protein B0T11DRAFT_17694 [Plectosphaerella cucumerina]|uniref:Uncharacterized protein n=1 Tax=Plectosphaerella cucumerina TaxID=40658 RepID=A0A8K0TUA3_9PEZI|nr:hypothetical protein B0T11DRAFT_17694 [Plectosphaerella cucumerina]